jgi:tRNA (cytidine56-2'-O)-methyltransferase
MANSKPAQPSTPSDNDEARTREIVVLRWGHRAQRDVRLTTHVALAARAFGASGLMLSDTLDEHLKASVEKVTKSWGGSFRFEMGAPWKSVVRDWKTEGGIVVHLTIYGENIQASEVLSRIRASGKKVLLLVGSQKVPPEFFSAEVSDFNVAVGNQPHSECAAVAVFLDRFFEGKELSKDFGNAKVRVVPQERGKKTEVDNGF